MAHPYHHSLSSTKPLKLNWQEHFALHDWLDSSKAMFSDARHRALFHHTAGVYLSKKVFKTLPNAQKIARDHILEDLGFLPNLSNWLKEESWNKKLVPSKKTSQDELKPSLLKANPFPHQTQKKLSQCVDILLTPEKSEKLEKNSPLRFFYFSSAGPYLAQNILGPLLPGKIPTRTACEYVIQKTWGIIPSHQDIMTYAIIEDWMWKKAQPLSKTIKGN
jgi:hypothetical protein